MAKDTKNINIEVHQDIWKKLKILSVHKDLSLQDIVRDILERAVSNKKLDILVPDIN